MRGICRVEGSSVHLKAVFIAKVINKVEFILWNIRDPLGRPDNSAPQLCESCLAVLSVFRPLSTGVKEILSETMRNKNFVQLLHTDDRVVL